MALESDLKNKIQSNIVPNMSNTSALNMTYGTNLPNFKNNIELFNPKINIVDGLSLEKSDSENYLKNSAKDKDKKQVILDKLKDIETELKQTEDSQSFLGKAWSWFKNKTDGFLPVASSNIVRKNLDIEKQKILNIEQPEIFKELTGVDFSEENFQKFLNGEIKLKSEQALDDYKEGQEMVLDTVGDMVSGFAAMGAYSAIMASASALPFLNAVIIGAGTTILVGGIVKASLKAILSGKNEFSEKDFNHDFVTGAFSGILAPFTAGIGGAAGRAVAAKAGLRIVKSGTAAVVGNGAKTGFKESLKSALINPAGYEYSGIEIFKNGWKTLFTKEGVKSLFTKKAIKNFTKLSAAYGAEMATDGVLGGMIDGGFRNGYDSDWNVGAIAQGAFLGGVMGGIMAPAIGGSMKIAGHIGNNIGKPKTTSKKDNTGILYSKGQLGVIKRKIKDGKFKLFQEGKISIDEFANIKNLYSMIKKNKIRLGAESYSKLMNKAFENPYLAQNKDMTKKLVKTLVESVDKSDNFVLYRFSIKEITDILSVANERNIEYIKLMLNAKNKERYLILGRRFKEYVEIFSKHKIENVKNLIKMMSGFGKINEQPEDLAKILGYIETYPKESALLSANYSPLNAGKFFYGAEELLKLLKNCSKEKLELAEILCSEKIGCGHIDNSSLIKLLKADIDINLEQAITFVKNNVSFGIEIDNSLSLLTKNKGKEFSVLSDKTFVVNAPRTKENVILYLKNIGVSEREIEIFTKYKWFESVVSLIEFDYNTNNSLFGGIQKRLLIKEICKIIEMGRTDLIKSFEITAPLMKYLNKENYEVFTKSNKNATVQDFVHSIRDKIVNIECQNACSIISKLTGRKIYEKDIIVLGPKALNLTQFTEPEIKMMLTKLKELDLINENANILTMLSSADELLNINPSPVLKDFAKILAENKYIEESQIIFLLRHVQSDNPKIMTKKIQYANKLINNSNLRINEISDVMENLCSTNYQILSKQIKLLDTIINKNSDNSYIGKVARFLKSDSLKDFDRLYKILDTLMEKYHNIDNISGVISTILHSKNYKQEFAELALAMFNKKFGIDEIIRNLQNIQKYCYGNMKEFTKLYLKGCDAKLGKLENIYTDIIFLQISDINSLNIKQKLNIYNQLINADEKEIATLNKMGFDYDAMLEKLMNSFGVKRPVLQTSNVQRKLFIKQILANNNKKAENIIKTFDFAQYKKDGLPLKYSRKDFNTKIEEILKDLPENEVGILLKHFGLERGSAGFDGLLNNRPLNNESLSTKAVKAAKEIKQAIDNFTLNNEVMISNIEEKEILDGLIKGFPEFTSIVGKIQHGQHAYSIDIHTLKVLQSAMNNPLYETLSDTDKTILKYAILLHDLGKKGGVVDEGHAALSADYAWSILNAAILPQNIKDRIIDIVDNHHWFELYNNSKATAENIAVHARCPEDLTIYEIFAKADLENVSSTFHLDGKIGGAKNQAEFEAYMKEKFKPIEEAVNRIYEKANLVFDTQFMHNGDLFERVDVQINGKTEKLKVLDFTKLKDGESLEKYGFAPGVTRDNARFIVHMTKPDMSSFETVLKLTDIPTYQSTWSSSLIKFSNNRTYYGKDFGLILEVPQANLSEAFWGNSGSGGEKTISQFQYFLFGERFVKKEVNGKMINYDVRHYVKDNFIKEMKERGYELSNAEYAQISKFLFNKKYLSQLRKDIKIGNKIIKLKDLRDVLEKSRDSLFFGDEHSELIPINPKVKGIFVKAKFIQECPEEVLAFCNKYDLPIILMKPAA